MKRGLLIGLFFTFILLIFFVNAYTYNGNKIVQSYYGGDRIEGTVNLTLKGEGANELFTSNFNGSITVLDLLRRNNISTGRYNCSTSDCGADYVAGQQITNLALETGKVKSIGFKIPSEDVESIDSIKFSILSDAPAGCYEQLLINVFDRNESFIYNTKYKMSSCSKNNGCFNSGLNSGDYLNPVITPGGYCEKITLGSAPAYEIGAKVTLKTGSAQNNELFMELFDIEGNYYGECFLPKVTQTTSEVGCIINYSNLGQKEFLVCVSSNIEEEKYSIRAEQNGDKCGTANRDSGAFNVDYEIYGKSMQFDSANIIVNEENFEAINLGESLIDNVNNYIYEKYNGVCPDNGCIIPFSLRGIGQNIVLSDIELKYSSSIGSGISSNFLYLLEKEEAEINSGSLNLNLRHANFIIPTNSKEKKFELFLDGAKVFSQNISVTPSFNFDISPKTVLIGLETEFRVLLGDNISYVRWDFGDGNIKNTSEKIVSHKYTESGEYIVEVEVKKSKDGSISKRKFDVFVGNAKDSVEKLMKVYEMNLGNLTKQINTYPPFVKTAIERKYDLISLNASLERIRTDLNFSSTEEDYVEAVEKLIELDIPSSISVSRSGNLPIIVGAENINIEYIKEISLEEKDLDEEKVKADIIGWNLENYDSKIDYQIISAVKENNVNEPILTKIKVIPNPISGEDAYLIIDYPIEAIKFASAYGERAVGSGTAITLSGNKEIEFIIDEDIEIENLGMYISPEINRLGGVYEYIPFVEKEGFKTFWFILFIVILIIITLVAYIFLQEWYKRNYESHLFRNKDDLYNIVNFIYNSRSSGMSDSDIKNRLSKSNWKGEQITYAFNKIDGKRTGMWEIPIFKSRENKKVREEIAKRHPGGVDTRFIKRPGF